MYYIIHIATAFQSFKATKRDLQELIWTKTLNDLKKKDPSHSLLSATLDQYLAKQATDPISLTQVLEDGVDTRVRARHRHRKGARDEWLNSKALGGCRRSDQ